MLTSTRGDLVIDLEDIVEVRDGRVLSYWANGKYDTCDDCHTLWPCMAIVYRPLAAIYVCPLCVGKD